MTMMRPVVAFTDTRGIKHIGPIADADTIHPRYEASLAGSVTTNASGLAVVAFAQPLTTPYCVLLSCQDGQGAIATWSALLPTGFTITTRDFKPPGKVLGGVPVCWLAVPVNP